MANSTTEHEQNSPTIHQRLQQLPASQYRGLIPRIAQKAGVGNTTVWNTIKFGVNNIKVLRAIAEIFGCSIEDVLSQDFAFQMQKSELPTPEDLAAELGLSKAH